MLFMLVACGSSSEPQTAPAIGAGTGGVIAQAGSGGLVNGGSSTGGSVASGGTPPATGGTSAGGVANGGSGGATGGVVGNGGMPSGGGGGDSGGAAAGGTMAGAAGGGAGGGSGGGGGVAGSSGGSSGGMGSAVFTVDVSLASDVDPNAPGTVGIVTFSVDAALTTAAIEFGLDTNYGMTAPVDLAETDHRTLLLGMKPSNTYHLRVVGSDGAANYASSDYTVDTGPPPTTVSVQSYQVANQAALERGFIVTSYWQGNGSAVPFILDADGDIVWWARNGPTGGIARARMSADGKNMWMISASNQGATLQRVSMDTLDAQTYQGVIGSHDITPVTGATMAYLDYGESDCNSIFEIDPTGNTTEVFEAQGVVGGGMCHGNAVRYSQTEDLYTYSNVSEDIFVINRSGQVQWRLSERVSGGNGAWGGIQHGHQLLDDGILIFANQGGGNQASAAIEYSLTGEERMNVSTGDFSQNLGDVQRLPGGNTLITFSNDSIIKEIDAQENVVLTINGGGSRFGYALWRETLYGPPPDIAQ